MTNEKVKVSEINLFVLLCCRPSYETILGVVGHKQEIFLTENCEDTSMAEIDEVVSVDRLPFTNWHEKGNYIVPDWSSKNLNVPNTFFYQKRFVGIPLNIKVLVVR